ncbi:MAG: SLBB domain-containing protein, partial [Elusimicrobiota bacterium]
VKAASKAEVVIANGAECEPLLQKDQAVLRHFTGEVLDGLELLRKACGAARGVLAVKAKHKELVAHLEGPVRERGLELFKLGDFYPSGDEYCLVYDVTGRLIPSAGIPIQVGVVVQNVETLYNAARAAREPVTDTFVTVAGAVRSPRTLRLPVGTSMEEALALAGGAKVPEYAVLDGGAMMGKVVSDLSQPLTKTSSGFILLPKGHALLGRKGASREVDDRSVFGGPHRAL